MSSTHALSAVGEVPQAAAQLAPVAWDVAALTAVIREATAQVAIDPDAVRLSPLPPPGLWLDDEAWRGRPRNRDQARASLEVAAEHADVGEVLPELSRFGGFKRRLARFAARIVFFLARPLTRQQRCFNLAVLEAVRAVARDARRLEAEYRLLVTRQLPDLRERCRALEDEVRQARSELKEQERRLTLLVAHPGKER